MERKRINSTQEFEENMDSQMQMDGKSLTHDLHPPGARRDGWATAESRKGSGTRRTAECGGGNEHREDPLTMEGSISHLGPA